MQERRALPPPDYLAALELQRRTAAIQIGGELREITRAPLGLHYRLRTLDDPLTYICLATGVDEDSIEIDEIAPAFEVLLDLNAPGDVPAVGRFRSMRVGRPPAGMQYEGRWLANLIHMLAYHYGWTADYILAQLGPEEALYYLQEIIYEVHQAHEFRYSLSEMNREPKTGRQKPYPRIDWLQVPYEEPTRTRKRVDERFVPAGNVIRFDEARSGA